MPDFTKLNAEELDTTHGTSGGERAKVREQYRGYLQDLNPGEGGELKLYEDEKKVTVKNRLKRAADDLKLSISFRRSRHDTVRFRVEES